MSTALATCSPMGTLGKHTGWIGNECCIKGWGSVTHYNTYMTFKSVVDALSVSMRIVKAVNENTPCLHQLLQN